MGSDISAKEVDLILEKLYSESVPVVAFYKRDGVKVMKCGVLAGVSKEHGIVVANDAGPTPAKDYLTVGIACKILVWQSTRYSSHPDLNDRG